MNAGLRPIAVFLLLLIAATAATAQTKMPGDSRPDFKVSATPVQSFDLDEPERIRFGRLEFLGGLVLDSDEERFGGISGIRMLDENDGFLAITDRGHWIRGRLRFDGRRPSGIDEAAIAPMLDRDRRPLASGSSFDTEALALGKDGDVFVGIERTHRILQYDFGKEGFPARARDFAVPRGIRNLPHNQGIEGLVFVPHDRPLGGSLIAFSERGLDRAGNMRAFILGGEKPGEFSVRRSGNFDITDAALIPGGDILILERSFSWIRGIGMRIRLLRLSDVAPGKLVDGEILIEAGNAHPIDNMEALAVHMNAGGETILTIVSDDNFSWLQRTLLLRFALTGN